MSVPHDGLPTLTEVIAVVPDEPAASAPMPLAPDSVPLDHAPPAPAPDTAAIPRLNLWGEPDSARLVDDVVQRLQPTLEAWVRDRLAEGLQEALQDSVRRAVEAALAQAVDDAVRAGVAQAGADLAQRLRSELPALARAALQAARPDSFAG